MRAPGRRNFWPRAALLVLLASGALLLELPGACRPALEWREDLEPGLAEARSGGRPVALSFWASWCSACRRFERQTLRQVEVRSELERFVRIRVDVSLRTPRSEALMRRFGVEALPSLVLLDARGEPLPDQSASGALSPSELLPRLRAVR